MSVYTGSYLCGSVTYEAEGVPRRVLNAIVTGVRRSLVVLHVHMLCLIWAKSKYLINYSGGAISEFVDKNTEHGFKMINRFCSNCGSPVEMHVERVPDGQFVPLGTIDQRHTINLNEGLWGEFALPHVAFKDGREVRKQGGSSDLI